ncbi:F0F1 ATP synthase subunit delta [Actinopolymorpha alba]|uniref:F0F1 ATP synthase subunit delta n=1 Tax=Actinopolymorpha alba TaxID=533267 RepID=UPI000376986E|nr:F0F1 ATP synthase subunit delta [Actinopolymorpha alba]
MTDVRGVSRSSLASLREQIAALPGGSSDLIALGGELFAVTSLLDGQPSLRRALTDPARTPDERAGLVASLLRQHVSQAGVDLVSSAVSAQWSRVRDLVDALEYLGVLTSVRAAEEAGSLDDLEDQLFRFARLVQGDVALARALTDRTIASSRRAELARTLLQGKAAEVTVRLVEQAVVAPRGLSFTEALDTYAKVAAEWRRRLVATVYTAVALGDAERARLAQALRRQYGHDVHLNILVDPGVIGGVRVELGDEVVDGTIASRLDEARRRLAG